MNIFDTDKIWDVVVGMVLAITGGLVSLLNAKDKKKVDKLAIVIKILTSAFTGLMVYLAASAANLEGPMMGLVTGIGGYGGTLVLDAIMKPSLKPVGIEIEDKSSDKSNDNKEPEN